ncbi:glycosyltransferase [Thiocystis violacea]|uniref:glycosyltransferase n=1 Tax=Thiocystis violacea TaxID=13725 RepID=UPI0019065686|nr:glycosyltransferase [Thiocystis violacea]MBK1718860.1 glycosyl transferase [Thiocystis violacea]
MSAGQRPIAVFASFSGAGGVERMLVNLLRGFVELGQAVDLVLVRADSPHLAHLPAGVNPVRLRASHTFLAVPELASYLRERRPVALLAAKDRAGRAAVLARALSGVDTRLVLRLGTNLSTAMAERRGVERWLRYLPIRRLYPAIDRIVAVSGGVADDTALVARIPRERIDVIRNPVITPELFARAAEPCPHPWLEPGQPPVLMGAGRLQRQKDFPTLIRAFARVRAARDSRLMILGEGSARPRLEALIAELGLTGSVALPGFQANPYRYLARASLFVLSSAWEGSPNVLTEAMALGIPVASTDCPSGPVEILDGGRHGPLVPVGDAEALAEAMLATLDRPPSPAALQEAVAEYEQGRSARAYLEALGVAVRDRDGDEALIAKAVS